MTKITKFIREVVDELRKTTWPWDPKERGLKKYKELIDSTIVVVVAMVLLAAWINMWDIFLNGFVRLMNHVASY
jgi:preprotein translocase subunit SecE